MPPMEEASSGPPPPPQTMLQMPVTASTFTVRDRKLLMHKIQELGPTAHEEIFKILNNAEVEHTQNSNGIFVNLSTVPDEVVRSVHTFVTFCIDNKTSLDDYDKWLNECKFNSQSFERATTAEEQQRARAQEILLQQQKQQLQQQQQHKPPFRHYYMGMNMHTGAGGTTTTDGKADDEDPSQTWDFSSMDRRADNVKFMQARKKYAKRRVPDKKDAVCDTGELVVESFLLGGD